MRVLLLLWTLGGCGLLSGLFGEDEQGTEEAATAPQQAPTSASDAGGDEEAGAEAEDDFVYNPIGKRDPFRPFLSLERRGEAEAPRTPLQKYELDQYQLVGIVWGIERPRALVEDPEGIGHVLEVGTYIGRNWGKVTRITPDSVVVTEEYKTVRGELVVNNITLALAEAQEGGRR